MLQKLHIKNFVLIEDLEIDFGNGLNILTGETGAGKSILIDAISAVLGEKMTTDLIRTGFERATVEGSFDISDLSQVKNILTESGIDFDDDLLIMRRELYSTGKGRCFANSIQIPVSKMEEIAEYLIDIHGQNEHQNITRVTKHRELLDSFAGLQKQVEEISVLYKELYDLKERIKSSEMDEHEKVRRIEYLTFALKEIKAANLKTNEEEELKEESNLLSNSEKIFSNVNTAHEMLHGNGSIVPNLKKCEQSLSSVADIDPSLAATLDSIRTALYTLEDATAFLRSYESQINFSEQRINEVEERLSLIQSFRKKYGSSIQEILQFAEKSQSELESISNSDELREKLTAEYKKKVQETKTKALFLSQKRLESAKILEEKVMAELKDLNMQGTIFRVSIKREINQDGMIELENKIYVLYPTGLDRVEFLLSANEGESLQQLRKVASGGEMSRIMLAIKKVILSNDIVGSLIFDEVDTGISGKTAEIVGKKLKFLSKERQILVITHLPQIAAMSDTHFTVSKEMSSGRTFTNVKNLNRGEKIQEVARMLAGEKITELSKKHAEEMIMLAEKS